jgi:tetratricopeptide (TPR) repeat protein
MFLLRTGRYSEALEQARAGFGWASRAGDLYTQAELEQIEAQAGLKLGRAAEAGAALERFRLLAERLEYPEAVLAATLDQGQLAALLDRHEEAIRLYREAEAGVRRWGQMQYALARIHNLIALSQLRLGLPQEALGSLESAKAVAARLEVPAPVRAQTRALEGAALALLGELGRALELLEDLPPAADLAPARAVQALLYRGLGQPDRAEQVLRAALASPELEALSRGLLLTQLGSIHGSPGLLGEAERLVQGGPGRLAQAQLWLAQAQQAEPSEGLTLGRRALGVAESLGLRSLEAQAHLWIAGALLAQGHPAEARPHSARAAELAENQALLRPEALLTHFRVLDRLGDPAAAAVLEAARTWLLETAEARVPPQHRPGFLDHPVHRALLAEAQRPQRT